jgi:hypothetical protein
MGIKVSTSNSWNLVKPLLSTPTTPITLLNLVDSLIKIIEDNENFEILNRIDKNIQKLIKVNMEAGKDHLRNALSTENIEDRKQWLKSAINSFIYAKSLEASPENIKAMIFIALCFTCMDSPKQADVWYHDSFQKAYNRHDELFKKLKNITKGNDIWDWLDLPVLFTNLSDIYIEIFAIEKQIQFLEKVISKRDLKLFPKEFYFSYKVQEIQKWHLLLNKSNTGIPVLLAFDEYKFIDKAIKLSNGKEFSPSEITGSFRRNGEHLKGYWVPDEN